VTLFEPVEDGAGGVGEFGVESHALAVDVDGRRAGAAQGLYELLDADPGAVVQVAADGEGGEHDGQVRFDGFPLVVEDWPGT
jgi:hypothetical protein